MTNYNERLDELLANLVNQVAANEQRLLNGNATRKATIDSDSHATTQAKQAITPLFKELVAEAKPARAIISDDELGIDRARKSAANHAIDEFEQNLLKELKEL